MRIATLTQAIVLVLTASKSCIAFPQYGSLVGLTREQVRDVLPRLKNATGAQPPPPPINDTSSKLVNDAEHPWKPLREGDIRGPCPGLNTLASHGWIDRSGIDTPANIVNAVQNGFNMGWNLAMLITYAAMIVDGNQVTNLLSIGSKTDETGISPPPPAIVGGLDTHAVFEGDASMTRGDFYFGDNHDFNETLFEEFSSFANKYGDGYWNLTVAGYYRYHRLLDSQATNPDFNFTLPRVATAYAEATFPSAMFVSGLTEASGQLSLADARGFFQDSRMPDGFHRRNGPFGFAEVGVASAAVQEPFPFSPGWNEGVGNYIVQENFPGDGGCAIYQTFINETVLQLYPDPEGALLDALKENIASFYLPVAGLNCTQLFPYGT